MKLKTSPARLAQLLQPSLAFCFSLQPMTAHWTVRTVIGCKLKQTVNEGCNSCASLAGFVLTFIACFILLVVAPLALSGNSLSVYTFKRQCRWRTSSAVTFFCDFSRCCLRAFADLLARYFAAPVNHAPHAHRV